MTAVGETNSTLMTQCLDFCQALALQGMAFKFSVSVGSTFNFSLDTSKGKDFPAPRSKKMSSPSTLRRNAKRREEFLKRKTLSDAAAAAVTGVEDLHSLIHHLATSRVRVAGPQKGRRGQVRTEEAELDLTTSFF